MDKIVKLIDQLIEMRILANEERWAWREHKKQIDDLKERLKEALIESWPDVRGD